MKEIHLKALRIASCDLTLAIALTIFTIACANARVPEAPFWLTRVQQLLYYDLSMLFMRTDNFRSCYIAISAFVVFGLGKVLYSITEFKKNKILFSCYLMQGLMLILLSLVNEDYSTFCHYTFAIILFLVTLFLIFYHSRKKNYENLFLFCVQLFVSGTFCCVVVICISYISDLATVKATNQFDCYRKTCYLAPSVNFGYHEWAALLWVFGIDYLFQSALVEDVLKKLLLQNK